MSREKNVCRHVVPVYYGDKGIGTRGDPFKGARDYYYECHFTNAGYIKASTITKLCDGCNQYDYIKPLTKEEIKEKYYGGKDKEVMVVSSYGYYFKKI